MITSTPPRTRRMGIWLVQAHSYNGIFLIRVQETIRSTVKSVTMNVPNSCFFQIHCFLINILKWSFFFCFLSRSHWTYLNYTILKGTILLNLASPNLGIALVSSFCWGSVKRKKQPIWTFLPNYHQVLSHPDLTLSLPILYVSASAQ